MYVYVDLHGYADRHVSEYGYVCAQSFVYAYACKGGHCRQGNGQGLVINLVAKLLMI